MEEDNEIGELTADKIMKESPSGKDNFCFFLFILNQLPISEDFHWYILGMLKLHDVK